VKIWYQSSAALGVDSTWDSYHASLTRHVKRVARPNTDVDVYGVLQSHPLMESSKYVNYLNQAQIIDNAIQAEIKGYDAICIACTLDPGYFEIKEVVRIPVIFLSETCFHLASILADKFSLLANSKNIQDNLLRKIKQYGLQEHYIKSDPFNLSLPDVVKGFEHPQHVIDIVKEAGRKAIDQGASILIPACNILNMVLVDANFRKIDEVPILDTAGAMVKTSEFMVDLNYIGISRNLVGIQTTLSKEQITDIRHSYSLDK